MIRWKFFSSEILIKTLGFQNNVMQKFSLLQMNVVFFAAVIVVT